VESFWHSNKAQSLTGAAVLVIVSLLCIYLLSQSAPTWNANLTGIAALFALDILCFFLIATPWAQRSRARLLTLLWLDAAVIVMLYVLVNISFVAILGIVWIVQATELLPIRMIGRLLLGSVAIFTASQIWHWGETNLMFAITGSLTLALFHLFAVIATHRAKREQELREETAALNRELLATRELLSEHSRQAERLRIARDLHDLLGHHLTAQILQLEVATHITDGQGRQKVEQALALGKLLLSDLRTAVSELREDEPIDFEDAINKLAQGLPGIDVVLECVTPVDNIRLAETLLRCTREALTNVLRHSGATECRIRLIAGPDGYMLSITDNGRQCDPITPGNGLKGIEERIKEAGGQVNWSCDDGFTLAIQVPG